MKKKAVCMLVICCLCGCGGVGERTKRAGRQLNAKTHRAKQEFHGVQTTEAKLKVAEEYFRNAPTETQELEDRLHGRNPKVVK